MRCPKCGYHSFDHLDSCKKCGQNLIEHKEKFNIRGFFYSGHKTATAPEPVIEEHFEDEETPDDGTIDFGFDFLDEKEDEAPVTESNGAISFDYDEQNISINQPFGVDSETVPADDIDSDGKPEKGPEFAF